MSTDIAGDVKSAGREAANSKALDILARIGLSARGIVYLLIGWLASRIAFGDSGQEADKSGALRQVADTPLGSVLLWALAVGFAGMFLWRLSEAVYGPSSGEKKATKRAWAAGKAVLYAFTCVTTVAFVMRGNQPESTDSKSKDITAQVFEWPGGRYLVMLVGLALAAGGAWFAVRALRRKFREKLRLGEIGPRMRKVVELLGSVGGTARGVVFAAAGAFLLVAAVRYDPSDAKGLDETLRAFAGTPLGPWLLVVVALGLVLFGLYSFCEARWRRV